MMRMFRNRLFLEGIVLGSVIGIVIGSAIAFQIGEDGVSAARRFVNQLVFRQPQQVQFELMLQ